jgi:ribA/ribD-fused uncharacterized protein
MTDAANQKMRMTDSAVYFVGGPFSQWFPSAFEAAVPLAADDKASLDMSGSLTRFSTAEQAMMASKASLFGDQATFAEIMKAKAPARQKELGRQVVGFDVDVWNAYARMIVTRMNYAKFAQNDDLYVFMMNTGDRLIVEGAWYDKIWGVGLEWNDPAIEDPKNWNGTNWLGEALMMVRRILHEKGRLIDPATISAQF